MRRMQGERGLADATRPGDGGDNDGRGALAGTGMERPQQLRDLVIAACEYRWRRRQGGQCGG
ncbi:hypothetical protein [Streptomyces sp. NPDC002763]|uniref:hypothetical protein n=1 Tax=Streptomyces sp. NPDC002763 TaxID=3154427 RepID=UPI0033325A45